MSSAQERPVGAILDDLGVTLELRDQDRIVGVLVLAKVIDLHDNESPAALAIGADDASDWIASRGLYEVAGEVVRGGSIEREE